MAVKKKTKALPRARKKTGFGAAPENNFRNFNEYIRMEVDKKDIASLIKTYIRATFDKPTQRVYLAAPEYAFTPKHFIASTILWEQKGHDFPPNWNAKAALETFFDYITILGNKALAVKEENVAVVTKTRKTPAEIIKEKTSEFIGSIENILDGYFDDKHEVQMKYSIYDELTKDAYPQSTASAVVSYYTPLRDELNELVTKKTPDLIEGYENVPTRARKKYLEFVQHIIDDAQKYIMSKKATRAPRKPRVKSADKQVAKMQFLLESKEYKLKSIHPMMVVGAMRLYTFNTKYKQLTEYVSRKATGFEIKGTSLKGFDLELSRMTKVRKPSEVLPVALGKTPNQINKMWGTLTTKTEVPNGRLNKETIILRAMDK